jgi:hypothetical protein
MPQIIINKTNTSKDFYFYFSFQSSWSRGAKHVTCSMMHVTSILTHITHIIFFLFLPPLFKELSRKDRGKKIKNKCQYQEYQYDNSLT